MRQKIIQKKQKEVQSAKKRNGSLEQRQGSLSRRENLAKGVASSDDQGGTTLARSGEASGHHQEVGGARQRPGRRPERPVWRDRGDDRSEERRVGKECRSRWSPER